MPLKDLLRLVTSPPLNLDIRRKKGVAIRLVRRDDAGDEFATTIHPSHSGRWIENHILVKLQDDIKQLLRAESEDFVFRGDVNTA